MINTAILFLTSLAAAIIFIVGPENPMPYMHGTLISGVFSVIMLFFFFREWKRCRKTIVISPEGIKTEEGELLETKNIDYCYIHFCDFFIRGGRGSYIDKSFLRLIVIMKDGRRIGLDLQHYGRFPLKKIRAFHQEINALPGMPLFKEPVIERF